MPAGGYSHGGSMGPMYHGDRSTAIGRFVAAVEAIRQTRRAVWQSRRHPEGKRFTQAELRELAYPSYHHLLDGTTGQLPCRHQVQFIADYLECSSCERNELLVIAEYLPERVAISETEHQRALANGCRLLRALAFPRVLLDNGWHIAAGNTHFHALHDIDDIVAIPLGRRTAIHYLFDPALPFRPLLGGSGPLWESNVAHLLGDNCVEHFFELVLCHINGSGMHLYVDLLLPGAPRIFIISLYGNINSLFHFILSGFFTYPKGKRL